MNNKHEVKLCECSNCGNQYPLVRRRYVAQNRAIYAVQCQRCHKRTFWFERKYKAVKVWNMGSDKQ